MKKILFIALILIASASFAQTDSAFEAGTLKEAFQMDSLKMDSLKNEGLHPPHLLKATLNEFSLKPLIGKKDVLIYVIQFVAGAADGMNQAIVYHHALEGYPFWDYNTSWERKYRQYPDDLRPAFPGAKTWLVAFTDGNHSTRGVSRGGATLSIMIGMSESNSWAEIFKKIIICSLINRAGFTLVYDHILK